MVNQIDRFRILQRDNFTCAYCGAKPGNDRLHVDHLVPQSWNGSDDERNLVAACDRCNGGKSNIAAIPKSLCEGSIDGGGWITWRAWGRWSLKFCPFDEGDDSEWWDRFVLSIGSGFAEYWIGLSRVHEPDWEEHMEEKNWFVDDVARDFYEAIEFCRAIIKDE